MPAYGFERRDEISARTRRAAVELCRTRRAFFLADPLADWTDADAVLTGARSLESDAWGLERDSHTAVYVPQLVVPSPAGGPALTCGPSGAVAGVLARIDRAAWGLAGAGRP